MTKAIHKIDKVLRKALRRMDLKDKLEGYRIWSLWSDLVGEQIARRTQPDRLRNRILFIRVSNSTWMQQLQTMKPMLLERIRKAIKSGAVNDIRFSLGEVDPPVHGSEHVQPEEPKEIELSSELEEHLEGIKDAELKALMRRIILKQAEKTVRQKED
jgi:predicted nucleic acid-binding Zn ribbon protein